MSIYVCQDNECAKPARCRGLCWTHYQRWLKARPEGKGPNRIHGTAEDQFWAKVDKRGPTECWTWTARRNIKGYGEARFKGKQWIAHRFSYELNVGPIPAGLEIDHLCRNTSCVNPAHLEAVTRAENMRRRKDAMTHCRRGHEFTPENTKYHSATGSRVCRECMRDYQREWMRAYRARKT